MVDDEHLHVRQVRGTREVAAVFLLDMSSSTSTPVSPPEPADEPDPEPDTILYRGSPWDEDEPPPPTGPTVLDVAKESLAVICDALQILGDEHAIYGFSGVGARRRRAVRRQGLRRGAVGAHVGPAGGDAAALVHPHGPGDPPRHRPAASGVAARTRFLVVVSDGYPQDRDYGPSRGDAAYGVADTAKALEEAERLGIVTFCITVDPAGHDYLRVMCPGERYAVIDDVDGPARGAAQAVPGPRRAHRHGRGGGGGVDGSP